MNILLSPPASPPRTGSRRGAGQGEQDSVVPAVGPFPERQGAVEHDEQVRGHPPAGGGEGQGDQHDALTFKGGGS